MTTRMRRSMAGECSRDGASGHAQYDAGMRRRLLPLALITLAGLTALGIAGCGGSGGTTFDDVVREIVRQPAERWTEDQRHVVTEFFLGHIDREAMALRARARSAGPRSASRPRS